MKHMRIFAGALVLAAGLTLTGCATLFTKKTTPVVLVNPPSDLKVYEDGKELPIEKVQSHAKARGTEVTDIYFAAGVNVSKKKKHHTLTLESGGKKADVKLNSKASGGLVFLDVIFTGPLGLVIDASTKKWRKIKDNHIDVPAVVGGTQPKSQRQLRKAIRKQAD